MLGFVIQIVGLLGFPAFEGTFLESIACLWRFLSVFILAMSHQTTAKPIRQCLVVSKSGSSLGHGAEAVAVAMERPTPTPDRAPSGKKGVGVADATCKSSGRTLCAGIMNT